MEQRRVPTRYQSSTPSAGERTAEELLKAAEEDAKKGNKGAHLAEGDDATKGGSGVPKRLEARDYLTAAGIAFPPGASAVFDPASSRLIVKNTQENLDQIDLITENALYVGQSAPTNLPVGGEEARKVGLLPMQLELPRVGEESVVQGFGAPEQLEVKYFAEADRSRRHRWIFLLGAFGYLCFGGRHPWWRAAWVALALTAIPLVLWPGATATCNLLLAGWLVGLVFGRLARRFIFNARTEKEVAA
jgi:hypothetical protein